MERITVMSTDKVDFKIDTVESGHNGGSKHLVVRGRVANASAGQCVRAYDKDLRSEELLGTSSIEKDGDYEICYGPEQFARAEKRTADIRVAAYEADGRELVSSAIVFNAPEKLVVNLTIPLTAACSEYDRHLSDLRPILQEVSLLEIETEAAEQKAQDLDFLAGDSGIDRGHVAWLALAAGFEAKSGIPGSDTSASAARMVPAAVFYGWLREAMPDRWEALLIQPIAALRSALLAAIEHEIISGGFAEHIDGILETMSDLRRRDPGQFVVRGQILRSGQPFPGVRVVAHDVDMRSAKILGDARSDADGHYEIHYAPRPSGRTDIRVAVNDEAGQEIATSTMYFKIAPEAIIDVVVLDPAVRAVSEYERVGATVAPLLHGVVLADLTDSDVAFLAGTTGEDRQRVFWLSESARRARELAGPSPGAGAIPPQVFYGWFRQGLPLELNALGATERASLREALETSLREDIIPPLVGDTVDAILDRIQAFRITEILKPATEGERPSLGDLLHIAVPLDKHDAVAAAYAEHVGDLDALRRAQAGNSDGVVAIDQFTGNLQAFFSALEGDSRLTSRDVGMVKNTLALDQLTSSHLPLMRELTRMAEGDPSFAGLRGLAQLDHAAWLDVLSRPREPGVPASEPIGVPPGGGSVESYAQSLNQFIESALPTPTIAHRIAQDNAPESPFAAAKADLAVFFQNNPGFTFGGAPLGVYLTENTDEKLRGVGDRAALTAQLAHMERLSRIDHRFEPMKVLLADGIHSAQAAVLLGKDEFKRRYTVVYGDDVAAERAYNRANQISLGALTLYLQHGTLANAPTPFVLRSPSSGAIDVTAFSDGDKATWDALFGSTDLCDCEHCQSLYGASAYFVDLLGFLRQGTGNSDMMALDVLLERRPDLAELELSCDNTNTKLPYVDLVNEVLENAVVNPAITVTGDFSADDFARGQIPDEVAQALALTSKATLVTEVPGASWAIRDPGWRFTFNGVSEGTLYVRPFPQTAGTEAELAANPQHRNASAYEVLARAGYPWQLPFQLPVEQARIYLHQLGVERHQLMEAVTSAAGALSSDAVTAEYLGLSSVEAGIVTGAITRDPSSSDTAGGDQPWTFWGFPAKVVPEYDPATGVVDVDWSVALRHIPVFLAQSGLRYAEVLELLDTYFINPLAGDARLLSIVSRDTTDPATCDLNQLDIAGLTPGTLENLHRFVRLQRALGWSARDLDRAITAFAATELTPSLVRQVTHVKRLNAVLGLPIATLLAFWAQRIDSAEYASREQPGELLPSSYAELFRNKAVVTPIDEAFLEDPTQLSGPLLAHAPTLLGALQIEATDLALLTAGPDAVVTDNALSLANLSVLYRHATLARSLRLSIAELLRAKVLMGVNPFASTEETIRFQNRIEAMRRSGFDIQSLGFLLRHDAADEGLHDAAERQSAAILTELRSGLAKIDDDNTAIPDPVGELTRKKLTQLRWSDAHVDQVLSLLGDGAVHDTALATLPDGIVFPAEVAGQISYDAEQATLRFRGAMSQASRTALRNVTATAGSDLVPYRAAVETLFAESRALAKTFLVERMRAFELPGFSAPAEGQRLQRSVVLPDAWKRRVHYDTAAGQLKAFVSLTDADAAELLTLSTDVDYQDAVHALHQAPKTYDPAPSNRFLILSPADPATDPARSSFAELFDTGRSIAERFEYVLAKLCSYLRLHLSQSFVKQTLCDAFQLDAATVDVLLTSLLTDPGQPANRHALAALVSADWVRSSGAVSPSYYPDQFAVLTRVRKVTAIASRLSLTATQLAWASELHGAAEWLGWDALPVTAAAVPVPFLAWEKLLTGLALRGAPTDHGADLLRAVSAANDPATTKASFLDLLSEAGNWSMQEVELLAGASSDVQDEGLLNLRFPEDYRDGEGIARIRECFMLLKRLGATAAQLAQWSMPALADDSPAGTRWTRAMANASAVKNAVKAKYDEEEWPGIAEPLQDQLRERQRAALVSYLVAGKQFGRDEIDLYDHFLIDVEMGACMTTTRLKQATCSVQLFVQRCLMKLEPNVALTQEQAKEWNSWRKLYRVWEANRKVLLYPENWIEPELRDDKSPFFKAMENELLQHDVTADTAEDAVRHYLERLDQVARLEIVGLCRQPDANDASGTRDILHVFGRTYAVPHLYFYRRLQDRVWSPWEKLDLDIDGDHLIPTVWNGHVYLCWPIFTEKSREPSRKQRADDEDPVKYWEIKLAWSEYRHNKWLPKKLSRSSLTYVKDPSPTVPQNREDFSFTSQTQAGAFGSLVVDCYGPLVYTQPTVPPAQLPAPAKRPDYLVLSAGRLEPAMIKFTINGKEPPDNELANITVVARNHDTQQYKFTNHPWRFGWPEGGVGISAFTLLDNYAADYWVVQDKFLVNTTSPNFAFPPNKKVTVDLSPFHEASPVTEAPAPAAAVNSLPMRAMGRFQLDECGADIVAVPAARVAPAIQPVALEPLKGTRFANMMMVELESASGTFGASSSLRRTPGTFRVLSQPFGMGTYPFVFQDNRRTYFVELVPAEDGQIRGKARYHPCYHPLVCSLLEKLDRSGLDGLLSLETQDDSDAGVMFGALYQPDPVYVDLDGDDNDDQPDPVQRTPRENVDFRREGPYSLYNWEIFFHTPFLIATKLSKNQRFEEARTWFHFIFDPTSSRPGGRERFWRFKPFFDEASRAPESLAVFLKAASTAFVDQVNAWRARPFQPYVIARLRLLAFMKSVVMKYVENLVAWADQLFARDTIEAINEGTQQYLLAARILGKRPESVPPRAQPVVQTFRTLGSEQSTTPFSSLVDIESYIFPAAAPPDVASLDGTGSLGTMPLFCIPRNDKLLGYWDTVADRLFKIRHCMNIEGVTRELPTFDPPIDPALLVRAAAAGVDLNSVLSDLYAPLPHYRYGVMQRRASELCNDVRSLGAALLSALEKKDAEGLALLRSRHEIDMLSAVTQIRQQQVDEASRTVEGLREYERVITARQQYYLSRPFMNPFENIHLGLTAASLVPMALHAAAEATAGGLHLIPNAKIGAPPTMGATFGGANVGPAIQAFGGAMGTTASILSTTGSLSATMGGYVRRQDDWTHQADLATRELEQVRKQIAAAEIRKAITENERDNHERQVAHAKDIDVYMREKYTNAELYDWMVGQLSALYFQSYRLAYDAAKRAERSYRFELGLTDTNFIQFGYWDSLKTGLLAGERLQLDLRRMEVDHAENNKREYEVTKHVSMLSLDPVALMKLRQSGRCEIAIPEAVFDMDYPGHYLRRIKTVSLSIPCVTGPYTNVNCTLTLLKGSVRHGVQGFGSYVRHDGTGSDPRFTDSSGPIQSVVTSSGQNDSGLFETNLGDERYLPFEGAGAISTWRVELPATFQPFNYSTISDVIFHVRYTARNGGERLKEQAVIELQSAVNHVVTTAGATGLARLVSLRHEFPTEWHGFLNPPTASSGNSLRIAFGSERLPYLFAGRTMTIGRIELFIKVQSGFEATHNKDSLQITIKAGGVAAGAGDVQSLFASNGLLRADKVISPAVAITPLASTEWTMTAGVQVGADAARVDAKALDDVFFLFHYVV